MNLFYTMTWMNLKNIILSKGKESKQKKSTYDIIISLYSKTLKQPNVGRSQESGY